MTKFEHCSTCLDEGWYTYSNKDGEPVQEQCRFCHDTPNSIYRQNATNVKLAETQQLLNRAIEILERLVPRCSHCENFGKWQFDDEDGVEHLCDTHKGHPFYAHGPELIEDVVETEKFMQHIKSLDPPTQSE